MIHLTEDLDKFEGKTIRSMKWVKDDDWNGALLIESTEGQVALICVSKADDDSYSDMYAQGNYIPNKFNIKWLETMGFVTPDEAAELKAGFDQKSLLDKKARIKMDLEDLKKLSPDMYDSFTKELK